MKITGLISAKITLFTPLWAIRGSGNSRIKFVNKGTYTTYQFTAQHSSSDHNAKKVVIHDFQT